MKKEKLERIASILIMVGMLFSVTIFVGGMILTDIYSETITTDEEVPCYDKHDNIIKDTICYREYEDSKVDFDIFASISMLFIGIGIIGIILLMYTNRL